MSNDSIPVRHQSGLERITLGVRPGVKPSAKPPVRIFLGSEPSQYRAERVFIWSIERVRDPARVYQIFIMSQLEGFRTGFWTTGFTGYRFAVPYLAGYQGRAIYNDVDQIYLADPALLFDMDLGEHGYLAVSETDTSVMLLDCERMGRFWTLEAAQTKRKYPLVNAARRVSGTHGALPGEWNARDSEHREGWTCCLHYTVLHKQPWRPFPERFFYVPNEQGHLWYALEREADLAGFQAFTRERTTTAFQGLCQQKTTRTPPSHALSDAIDEAVSSLVTRSRAQTLLDVTPGASPRRPCDPARWNAGSAVEMGLLTALHEDADDIVVDGITCRSGLDAIPHKDLPWVIEALFQRASNFVFVSLPAIAQRSRRLGESPAGTIGQPEWWLWMFEMASIRHPGVHWRLSMTREDQSGKPKLEFYQGGRFPSEGPPTVWILNDHKPGHTTQTLGLAEELGWDYARIDLRFNRLSDLPSSLFGPSLVTLERESAERLRAPFPDLVISTGRRTAAITAWIRRESCGLTRTVQMGRMGVYHGDDVSLSVAPSYTCMYPDPKRLETTAPITRVNPAVLEEAGVHWHDRLVEAPIPRLALLVGGTDPAHELTPEIARRLGEDVAKLARQECGSVFLTTSRRTPPESADALVEGLAETVAHSHRWSPEASRDENPYLGYLALADALVVTGESASMIAEACATEKPVYIYPIPERKKGVFAFGMRAQRVLADAVYARAFSAPLSRRGITRPQRGLELLCARLLARGFVRSNACSSRLHDTLVERGLARIFDGKLASPPREHFAEVSQVAERVRVLMGTTQRWSNRDPRPDSSPSSDWLQTA